MTAMGELLSLKWNNHSSAFLTTIRKLHTKDLYCDATIACNGKYYPVHRMVLSTCSEYFEEIFKMTQCKHPFIIVNDIKSDDLENLLNYMYKGGVNVTQDALPSLIKAAEALKVRGLAVPDEPPPSRDRKRRVSSSDYGSQSKRSHGLNFAGCHVGTSGNQVIKTQNKSSNSVFDARCPPFSSITQNNDQERQSKINSNQLALEDNELLQTRIYIKEEPLDVSNTPGDDFDPPGTLDAYDPPGTLDAYDTPSTLDAYDPPGTLDAYDPPGTLDAFSSKVKEEVEENCHNAFDVPLIMPENFSQPVEENRILDNQMPLFEKSKKKKYEFTVPPMLTGGQGATPTMSHTTQKRYEGHLQSTKPHNSESRRLGRSVHSCVFCGYRCVSSTVYKIHVRKHTGERPFICMHPNCRYQTTTKSNLTRHVKSIHLKLQQNVQHTSKEIF